MESGLALELTGRRNSLPHTDLKVFLLILENRFRRNSIEKRVLIFNQQNRDSDALISALANSLKGMLGVNTRIFNDAIFCTNLTTLEQGYKAG